MASILAIAGGALINALALSGTNAAFSLLGDHGKAEMRQRDLAMEKLSKARGDWNRRRQQRQDLISKTHNEQRHAKQTFSDLDVAMQEYHEVTSQSCLLYTSPSPRDLSTSRMPSSA